MDRRGLAVPVATAAPKYFFAPIGGWRSDVIVNPFSPGEAMFFLEGENWKKAERWDAQMLKLGLNFYSPFVVTGFKG